MNHRESNPPNLEEPQDTAEPQQTRPPSLIMPVLSWVLPLVICGATIFLVVNCWDMSENWPKWILLVVLLSISSTLTYLSPNQRKNDKYRHVKVHATVGLVFNILTFCFVFLGMAAASLLMYANSPEGIAAIKKHRQQQRAKTWHERQVAREEEQRLKQQKAKRIADQRQAQSLRDFNKKHIPEPLITPQPLKREQYEVIVTSVEQDLAVGAWTFEGDVKIQPIKIKTRTSDLASKLRVRHVLWANDGSPLFYVCAGNSLLELDSENWRMVREVNLGSTITSVTRCKDGIAVSTTHRITILDSESLKVKTAIPVCGVNEVAGSPANNRLFVSFQQRNGAMAVLNLDTDTIEHIVTPEQLKGLGVDAKPKGHRPSSKFSDLRVTNDGKFLLAHTATAALRCAINNEKLCFLDSNRRGSVSQNGRYFANNAGVFDITKSLSSPIAKSRATFDWPDMLPTPGCKLQKLGGQWVADGA